MMLRLLKTPMQKLNIKSALISSALIHLVLLYTYYPIIPSEPDLIEVISLDLPRPAVVKRGATHPKPGLGTKGKLELTRPYTNNSGSGLNKNQGYKSDKQGGDSILESNEFLYKTWYDRIRGKLDMFWRPRLVELLKNLKLYKTMRTQVWITLDSQGNLVSIKLNIESGNIELDMLAFNAFEEAARFDNPPKDLINSQGFIEIPWDFLIVN